MSIPKYNEKIRKEVTQINPIIKESIELLQIAAQHPDGLSGVQTGFKGLDRMTSGWQKSDLIVIATRPAMGKIAFALSMLKNMAINFNIPVAFFSLEMSNVQVVNRLIVNVAEIPGEKFRNGRLERREWEQLDNKIKDLFDVPIYVDDTQNLSVSELRTKSLQLITDHKVKCIIVDNLQLMNANGMNFGSREQEISFISHSLKELAKELNIPIIVFSLLNHDIGNRAGYDGIRPQLSDLHESGAIIEQDADVVCFIHRPEYYKIYEDDNGNDLIGKAEIIVAKNRNGSTGDVLLRFTKEYARFQNLDDDMLEDDYQLKMANSSETPF